MKKKPVTNNYKKLIDSIGILLQQARQETYQEINRILVKTYWEIGKHIVLYEQKNKERAEYGSKLLHRLSKDLTNCYGKGFSRRNVLNMRNFFASNKKWQPVAAILPWTHYIILMSVKNRLARSFYEKECVINRWSKRELKRQINSMLFERPALNRNREGLLKLAEKGQSIEKVEDVIKDPYVFEFLQIPENRQHSEQKLEQKIIENLQAFLLELGKGFSFVARQYRITINKKPHHVDLVFYHRILKCFVLIDLKIGPIAQDDIGQMNMYLNYFKKNEMAKDDSEPIGIVLGAKKDHVLVEYALGGISNRLFVSKYQLSLPDKRLLQEAVKEIISREKEE